jgi:hypothetical protein
LRYRDEDILLYNGLTNGWELLFDGSDVGVSNADLDAFDLLADGSILMSFDKPIRFPELGIVDDADLVQFNPIQLGNNTIGTFARFFDGSAVELTTGSEDIDAIAYMADGSLLISTYGTARVGALRAQDEDLLRFIPTTLGATTAGSWELYFDGSAVALNAGSEDIGAATLDWAGDLYLVTKGRFSAASLTAIQGDDDDLFGCRVSATGETSTSCTFFAFFDGDTLRFNRAIDGISLGSATSDRLVARTTQLTADDPEPFEVFPDDLVNDDAEFDGFDEAQTDETPQEDDQIYLPFITR